MKLTQKIANKETIETKLLNIFHYIKYQNQNVLLLVLQMLFDMKT